MVWFYFSGVLWGSLALLNLLPQPTFKIGRKMKARTGLPALEILMIGEAPGSHIKGCLKGLLKGPFARPFQQHVLFKFEILMIGVVSSLDTKNRRLPGPGGVCLQKTISHIAVF